jgi:ribA/ribD-fused uncharacterized protein
MIRKNGYIFFWGDWPSNWHMSSFVVDGVTYNCMEQFMMAEKARLFGDELVLGKILASPYPRAQKEFGRKVRGYDDARWSAARYEVVLRGTIEKYRQSPELLALLLATTEIFVEASPEDEIWGIGMGEEDAGIEDPANWRGLNLLGKAITQARETLRSTPPRAV